jgi:hypothetical protein
MKKALVLACLTLALGGCASTIKQELAQMEKEGPGIWHMYVRGVHGDTSSALRMRLQGRPELALDEQVITVMSTESMIFSNPLKTHIGMTAKVKKSLGVEEGDYVEVKDGLTLLNAKGIPEVTTILCRDADKACKTKITLGLKTKDGETTTGRTVLVPFF